MAIIETPTTPPSIRLFGIKNASRPTAAIVAPITIVAIRFTIVFSLR